MKRLDVSYREKLNVVNILSGLVIGLVYAFLVLKKHQEGRFDLTIDYKAWGVVFLIFIAVSIVARIIIYIIFHILNAIATRAHDIPVRDERDMLIELKSRSNSYHTFIFSFMLSFVLLAMGKPFYWMFIVFILSGVLSEIVDNLSQIYYHRKGI